MQRALYFCSQKSKHTAMSTQKKIERKGYTIRCNMGYSDGCQTVASYSAMKQGRECARASSKTALLRQLTTRY